MAWISTRIAPAGGVNTSSTSTSNGTVYPIEADNGDFYVVYIDSNLDVVYQKSTDGGLTWGTAQTVSGATSATVVATWFDSWSGQTTGYIHIAYIESVGDEVFYTTIATEGSDAVSTPVSMFNGGSTLAGGALSIARSRGGNVYCMFSIDAGTENGFHKLANADVPTGAWSAALAAGYESATQDQWILLPSYNADNNDMMAIFYDIGSTELSRKLYDDSADTWAETSISTGITMIAAQTHFAACVDLAGSRNWVIAWNGIDTLNADLKCWNITEGAINVVTDVVTNSTDDQGYAALSIDNATGDLYAFYGGNTSGGETVSTVLTTYYKVSTDDGSTWGSETPASAYSASTAGMIATSMLRLNACIVTKTNANAANNLGCDVEYTPPAGGGVATPLFGGGVV